MDRPQRDIAKAALKEIRIQANVIAELGAKIAADDLAANEVEQRNRYFQVNSIEDFVQNISGAMRMLCQSLDIKPKELDR